MPGSNLLIYSYERNRTCALPIELRRLESPPAAAATGSRIKVVLNAVYDADGNLSTTTDQLAVTYETELTGATGGKIARNGSYKVNAKLDGLTGQDVTLAVTVANWDALSTQDVNLGQ